MARTKSRPLAAARALLRERHEAQQSALSEYLSCHAKVARLEASLAELRDEQTAALGGLADAATAAQLVERRCTQHGKRLQLTGRPPATRVGRTALYRLRRDRDRRGMAAMARDNIAAATAIGQLDPPLNVHDLLRG